MKTLAAGRLRGPGFAFKDYCLILREAIELIKGFITFTSKKDFFMVKNMLRAVLLACVAALPSGVFAQVENHPPNNLEPINRYELLDKTWDFIAMKCPDKIGAEAHYIQFFATLKLTVSNPNNINYGTYVKAYRDMRDNPRETGTYSLTSDEVGNIVLTLKRYKTGATERYMVSMVETNHLTLIRTDDQDKCNVIYAIAP